jgi:hypothetical protein
VRNKLESALVRTPIDIRTVSFECAFPMDALFTIFLPKHRLVSGCDSCSLSDYLGESHSRPLFLALIYHQFHAEEAWPLII